MVQAFGCVDGNHIPIPKAFIDSQDYFNDNQFYSLKVQAVCCDCRDIFLDVDCSWPDSVHDTKVFTISYVHERLRQGKFSHTIACSLAIRKSHTI